MSKKLLLTALIAVVVVLVLLFIFWRPAKIQEPQATAVYETNTTLEGDYSIMEGERVVIKNGATLTVMGNFNLAGELVCADGELNLTVNGDLTSSGTMECMRNDNLSDSDIGEGINIVAKNSVEFTDKAVVVSNGHVQLVDDENNLATTQEKIDELFDDAADDSGEGFRVGPFIPIELDETTVFLDSNINTQKQTQNQNQARSKLSEWLISSAQAQPVPIIRVGGTWIVGGWPVGPPPPNLNIPTPIKGVKRIILNFNFGPGRDVNLANWELSGPDGRTGKADVNSSCNAKGDKGENAFRFNVRAQNLTINNFTLNLGSGGTGGEAETKQDCNPGVARGGEGGEAGNFKMIGSRNFNITGEFRIRPGHGGTGGQATAYGKDGADGCPGEDGGEAQAYGGNGGDNKKGLKVKGTVNGIANIVIEDIVAGTGGEAQGIGGDGGAGTGGKCAGGHGGKATATGGKGGEATSKTVVSVGGDGGDAFADGGHGGQGGTGDAKTPGGNGGLGGDAVAVGGNQGKGKTLWGALGDDESEGGNGGNGGDGCPEGIGGVGGNAENPGQRGVDGKNICPVPPKKKGGVKAGNDVNPQPQPQGGAVALNPGVIRGRHTIGEDDCPTPMDGVAISGGPAGGYWQVVNGSVPQWLNISQTNGEIDPDILQMSLSFNCNITEFTTHEESGKVQIQTFDQNGTSVGDSFFDVYMDVTLP